MPKLPQFSAAVLWYKLIPAYYKNLSDADRMAVETPGDRDFEPYYYLYGDKKLAIVAAAAMTTRAGRLRLVGEGGITAVGLGDKSPGSETTAVVDDNAM